MLRSRGFCHQLRSVSNAYSDERFGIRKWHADPNHPDAAKELAVLGRDGYQGDREGPHDQPLLAARLR